MARHARLQFRIPDEEGWRDIKRGCKFKSEQLKALRLALEEVDSACERLPRGLADAEVKAALKTVDRLFANLEAGLERKDVADALRAIETFGALDVLLSANAASLLNDNDADAEIPTALFERFVARKRMTGEAIKIRELEELSLTSRQRFLSAKTPEAMLFVIRSMRRPIVSWLQTARPDKGGPSPHIDREFLIYMLARNAREIIGEAASPTSDGKFHNLCTWVFGACGMDDNGLEAAISRCLKKHSAMLRWHALPAYLSPVGKLTEEQIAAIPEDSEQTQ
jgi:hypothetical protein